MSLMRSLLLFTRALSTAALRLDFKWAKCTCSISSLEIKIGGKTLNSDWARSTFGPMDLVKIVLTQIITSEPGSDKITLPLASTQNKTL